MHLCINIPKSMLKFAFRTCIIFQLYPLSILPGMLPRYEVLFFVRVWTYLAV